MFPELFEDEPLTLRCQEVEQRPFAPTAALQYTLPDLPPVDWERIRQKQRAAAQHRRRRGRQQRTAPAPIVTVDWAPLPPFVEPAMSNPTGADKDA
jgi:hypothetical protein